jgi:hypothetical protein
MIPHFDIGRYSSTNFKIESEQIIRKKERKKKNRNLHNKTESVEAHTVVRKTHGSKTFESL